MSAQQVKSGIFKLGHEERGYSSVFTRGTASEWTELMMRLARSRTTSSADKMIARHLEWPTQTNAALRRRFDFVAMKTGTLAGIFVRVVYAKPKDGRLLAGALFLRDLPDYVWSSLWNALPVSDILLTTLLNWVPILNFTGKERVCSSSDDDATAARGGEFEQNRLVFATGRTSRTQALGGRVLRP